MTAEQVKKLGVIGALGGLVLLAARPAKAIRYTQQPGTMTALQLATSYRELVSSPVRVYINPTNDGEPDTGTPWAIDLAGYTKNYEAVKAAYLKNYAADLSESLIGWFLPAELSEFVAALWEQNKQVMS